MTGEGGARGRAVQGKGGKLESGASSVSCDGKERKGKLWKAVQGMKTEAAKKKGRGDSL